MLADKTRDDMMAEVLLYCDVQCCCFSVGVLTAVMAEVLLDCMCSVSAKSAGVVAEAMTKVPPSAVVGSKSR